MLIGIIPVQAWSEIPRKCLESLEGRSANIGNRAGTFALDANVDRPGAKHSRRLFMDRSFRLRALPFYSPSQSLIPFHGLGIRELRPHTRRIGCQLVSEVDRPAKMGGQLCRCDFFDLTGPSGCQSNLLYPFALRRSRRFTQIVDAATSAMLDDGKRDGGGHVFDVPSGPAPIPLLRSQQELGLACVHEPQIRQHPALMISRAVHGGEPKDRAGQVRLTQDDSLDFDLFVLVGPLERKTGAAIRVACLSKWRIL
jgi:hypothetical protein